MKNVLGLILATLLACSMVTGCAAPSSNAPSSQATASSAVPEAPSASPSPAGETDLARMKASYEVKLSSYLDLVLSLGVDFKEGDELIVEGSIESYEIMNQFALRAYEKGAKLVYLSLRNPFLDHANAKYMKDDAYKDYPIYPELLSGMVGYTREGAKVIELSDYFFEEQIGASEQALSEYPNKLQAAREEIITPNLDAYSQIFDPTNPIYSIDAKTVVMVPTRKWAKKIYPELSEDAAYYQLADDFFGFLHLTEEGSTMLEHLKKLSARRDKFNEMGIVSLHYASSTVNLEVPLHKNNLFVSMPNESNGALLAANIPSEEIFGLPTKFGANGTVENTRPLIVNGTQVIDGIKMEFKDGKLVNYSVKENPEAFEGIIKQMPEGVYLGEISMVSTESPIFQSGKVYYSTLIDENAAAHLAIGSALSDTNLKDGTEIDNDVAVAADHHDIIIGSKDLTVTATLADGTKVELLKDGVWAI